MVKLFPVVLAELAVTPLGSKASIVETAIIRDASGHVSRHVSCDVLALSDDVRGAVWISFVPTPTDGLGRLCRVVSTVGD